MKRIAFIASIVGDQETSSHLMSLYNESRIYNNENSVKGVFLVSNDIVLQVIEGDAERVAKASYRFRRSEHIKNFSVVINNTIDKPLFNNWPLRFVNKSNASHRGFIQKLSTILKPQLHVQTETDQIALEKIFDTGSTIVRFPKSETKEIRAQKAQTTSNPTEDGFEGKALMISGWPKASQIPMTPPLIKTCSLLSRGYIDYSELSARKIWPTQKALNSFLHTLDKLGILKSTESTMNEQQPMKAAANDKFSNLLKRFIHTPNR